MFSWQHGLIVVKWKKWGPWALQRWRRVVKRHEWDWRRSAALAFCSVHKRILPLVREGAPVLPTEATEVDTFLQWDDWRDPLGSATAPASASSRGCGQFSLPSHSDQLLQRSWCFVHPEFDSGQQTDENSPSSPFLASPVVEEDGWMGCYGLRLWLPSVHVLKRF